MMALFKLIQDNGPPKNEEKFKNFGNNIYELKTRMGSRILCFFGNSRNSLVLTHGFHKCKSKQLQVEKRRAIFWKKEYEKSSSKKV